MTKASAASWASGGRAVSGRANRVTVFRVYVATRRVGSFDCRAACVVMDAILP
jgi:hypothetical protein